MVRTHSLIYYDESPKSLSPFPFNNPPLPELGAKSCAVSEEPESCPPSNLMAPQPAQPTVLPPSELHILGSCTDEVCRSQFKCPPCTVERQPEGPGVLEVLLQLDLLIRDRKE